MEYPLVGGDATEATADPIQVLLVDDDRQWATLIANDIEEEATNISVTVTGSATECLETFENWENIDCIVSDYQMPGRNGLDLLEEIRERHSRFPFLLVTSQGSETVAARAIDAGVTDYIIKDFGGKQAKQFESKITQAVDHYRLQQAIQESEQRYRTVTEQSRDGIAILRYGRLLFCNERLLELSGRERETLKDGSVVDKIIYPADREGVRDVLDSWYEQDEQPQLREIRIERPDGTIHDCEYTGGRVEYSGEPATLVSIRDVTERKQRERELQWERELNRTIQETLVESRTRERLERQVTEQLQGHGYALAWIGEQNEQVLVPRAVGGDRRYVEAIDRSVQNCDMQSEPSIWTAQTGEPRFLQDFESRPSLEWSEIATGYNYRSGAAMPLVYNDITYGVLAVYHDQADRFDDTEQRLLRELADTVAFAIHSYETQGALAADQTVDVTVQVTDGYYLLDLARDSSFDGEARVAGTIPIDAETVIQYVDLDEDPGEPTDDAFAAHPDVQDASAISEENASRVRVTVTGQTPEAHLASQGVVVDSTTVDSDGATVEFKQQAKEDVRSTVQPLEERFGTVSVRSVTKREQQTDSSQRQLGMETLTDKQLAALKAAYHQGYFGQPRDSSATEIAESLGVGHSTFLRHLRAAQEKVFGMQFD